MTLRVFLLTFLVWCSHLSIAQTKNVTSQSLYWTRYYNQLIFNDKISWHNEIDMRRFLPSNTLHHLIVHTHLHYRFSPKFDAALGFTYSLQSPQDPSSISRLAVPELRPFQELTFSQPISKRLTLSSRFRIDERFISKNDGNVLLDGYNFNFRYRLRIQGVYLLNKKTDALPTTLKLSNEVMLNTGARIINNHFDQNRAYLGIEKAISKSISAELGYLWWYQQRDTGLDFFNRDIIRFTLWHRVRL
jgi:hypothetical protein